jgi:hypothetical protein
MCVRMCVHVCACVCMCVHACACVCAHARFGCSQPMTDVALECAAFIYSLEPCSTSWEQLTSLCDACAHEGHAN